MKTITITHCNRPDHTRRILAQIGHPPGWYVYNSVDGGNQAVCAEIVAAGWEPQSQIPNLGIEHHQRTIVDRVGGGFIVCLQDDLDIAPDAVELWDWFAANLTDRQIGISAAPRLGISGAGPHFFPVYMPSGIEDASKPRAIVNAGQTATAEGLCFHWSLFDRVLRSEWNRPSDYTYTNGFNHPAWDAALCAAVRIHRIDALCPRVARVHEMRECLLKAFNQSRPFASSGAGNFYLE